MAEEDEVPGLKQEEVPLHSAEPSSQPPPEPLQELAPLAVAEDTDSGVREFTCETCGKSFKRKNHLEVHKRTHTGETPLQCDICGYRCRQRASLTWHMRRHGGPGLRPFPCERCGRRFERPEGLKFHALKSHPEPRGT
ncbi:PREDICTED: zinc finger protein 653 [Chaetura pelagica]|uniref:zinc finger protein 653 n=1 Tax=Chaetura pelagica TaxID=8897 RepID=UPI0005231753|nr:PREDICTED: zinc finger protein 653 [Chaetura pelagica]